MSLYLCVLDDSRDDEEYGGFQLGQPQDFVDFLRSIESHVFGAKIRFRTLFKRADCDGEWSPSECQSLRSELQDLAEMFQSLPPQSTNAQARSLYDCCCTAEGDNLFVALDELCDVAIKSKLPIRFQ